MAKKQKLKVRIYIPINGENHLWYEVDEDGNEKWYLPKDHAEAVKAVKKMMANVSKNMSDFYSNNSEYWKGKSL